MDPAKPRLKVFNDSAELYDQVRPGYPDALVDAVLGFSGIPPGGRILELGCGTGQATRGFAARGYVLTCVEAGDRLAAIAARNFQDDPKVRVHNAYFEEWALPGEPFDLVLCATAFHHIEPRIRFQKSAQALKRGGTLAVFSNWTGEWEPGLRRDLDAIYAEFVPEDAGYDKRPPEAILHQTKRALDEEAAAWFQPMEARLFPWTPRYTSEEYQKLTETYSGRHHSLDPERKRQFYAAIAKVIDSRGGSIETPRIAALFMAKSS